MQIALGDKTSVLETTLWFMQRKTSWSLGRGHCPSPENFSILSLKMATLVHSGRLPTWRGDGPSRPLDLPVEVVISVFRKRCKIATLLRQTTSWNWHITYHTVTFPMTFSDCCCVSKLLSLIKTCEAGLVLSVTRILRAALTKFRVCVCMYVCMCNYSSQTTEPICIKIAPANRASYADCCRLLRFEVFAPPYL